MSNETNAATESETNASTSARMVSVKTPEGEHSVHEGTPVGELLADGAGGQRYLGAVLNHRLVGMEEPICGDLKDRQAT